MIPQFIMGPGEMDDFHFHLDDPDLEAERRWRANPKLRERFPTLEAYKVYLVEKELGINWLSTGDSNG